MSCQEEGPTIERAQKTLDNARLNINSGGARKVREGELIVQTVREVELGDDFYTQNITAINSASAALTDLARGEILKQTSSDLLAVAKKMMDALDVVKGLHPFVGVVVIAFKAVVNLELQRRENDRRVGSVLAQASDMMGMLLQLKDIKDPVIVGLHGETIEGRLQGVMKNIVQDIHRCGNTIDKYWKSKPIVKFFRSENWANEFFNICQVFSERKGELELALNIRTALRVDIAIGKLEQLIRMQSEREQRFEKDVKLRGGRDKLLENQDLLIKLLETSEQWEGRPQNKSRIDGSSNDGNKPAFRANEQNRLDISLLLHELNTPIPKLLEENLANFKLAFDKQASRIVDSINSSEARIIRTITTNDIFRHVKNPHLQHIWEQMKWRTNVKTQYFIAELYDYYMSRFSSLHRDTSRTHITSGAPSLAVPLSPGYVSDSDSETGDKLPAIDPGDEWCLKYLAVLYVPNLSEAFDSDANRLVSIREVNAFTSAVLPGWSLLQALAYWAAGWWVDSKYYCTRIQEVLESMISVQLDALPENRLCIARYLMPYTFDVIARILCSLAQPDSEDSDLNLTELASQHRKAQEAELADKLNAVKYEIDSTDSIKLFGSGRIECFLLPLLYLVLKRHLQIMILGRTVILVERELESATQSIQNILGGVDLRVKQLAEIFRQQETDPKVRFTWYARGLFNLWYIQDQDPDAKSEPWQFYENSGNIELEIDTSALKFGSLSPPEAGDQLEGPIPLVPGNSGQELQNTKEEFVRLWCLNELHHQRWTIPGDVPSYISSDEKQRFDLLSAKEDVQPWSSLAELHLRKRMTTTYCDACHLFIIDVQHYCIDCPDGDTDLCVECESLPVTKHRYTSNHEDTHNMLVFRTPGLRVLQMQARRYAQYILPDLPLAAAPLERLLPTGDDTSGAQSDGSVLDTGTSVVNGNGYTCTECGVKLAEIFYLCTVCEVIEHPVTLCRNCAFRDAFNVVKEHDEKHYLVKIKDKVQDADRTSKEEPVDSMKTAEGDALAALSSRVDNLTTMVESLDQRLGELIEKLHPLLGLSS